MYDTGRADGMDDDKETPTRRVFDCAMQRKKRKGHWCRGKHYAAKTDLLLRRQDLDDYEILGFEKRRHSKETVVKLCVSSKSIDHRHRC